MNLLKLKEVLKEKGVTSIELANKTGITSQSVSNIINGRSFPRPELLLKIAEVLDVDIKDLFHTTQPNKADIYGFIAFDNEVHHVQSIADLKEVYKKIIG